MAQFPVLTDSVVDQASDLLDFKRYLDPLDRILNSPLSATPFTIGVFGAWGSGKSTLLAMLARRLDPDKFVCVQFNPWVYRKEPNMLVPLLHTLHDALKENKGGRFAESARKISSVLVRLGADVALKGLTAGTVSVEKLEKLEEAYLKERGYVISETRRLRELLQKEADVVAAAGARIVLLIDDLDRCEPEQIIDVLESVKLFFDLTNMFVVLAIDKEVIDRGIQVKYNKFRFAADREPVIGAEYLEKMVQLPLQLYPLQPSQVGDFVAKLASPDVKLINDHVGLLITLVVPNPRKIKRVLNILAVTDAIRGAAPHADELEGALLVRLVVLQVQSADLYCEVVRQPDLLSALEEVYAGQRNPAVADHFNVFGSRREATQKLCQRFYEPTGYLAALFKDAGFVKAKAALPAYLSMLGI